MNQSHESHWEADPVWYKNGVIYEVHIRAFHDSNADGTGDLRGLTEKLDYLADLGVTALWLLPFYPSPLLDDGYDIADYYNVHPMYGTLGDFKVFLREAHRRGLRVITELVLNHTSDQHPWFLRARRAKPNSKWRDYYVWSDTADKYKGTRIIFKDTEVSNWTWDEAANAFYWHRFYSHQPDLNFDNPAVRQEMLQVLDFWLDLGVDGVRLDAVPYLYEREGTSCENLPETHQFLKTLRAHVDEKYAYRMLLAEANQWPDDAAAYFGGGKGDECHMAFHFPVMPRLFMALRMEDRVPIIDIMEQTPPVPETAQWALFLRNHDELTLEMVTDEERDYMYRMYAHLHQARLNLGIRRRLAPLLGNDRRRIELLNALLFSLPGTPVIYYGDEIGMGENIYLGDRNGVRTPMQWSADRNAGFSRANPQSLYLPIPLDPENHYEAVNVEVQQRNPHSLLWWMKRLIVLRRRWKAFGLGTLEFLHPTNRKILAFVRRYQDECLLIVANMSRFTQPVELELGALQSLVPVELFGRMEFPAITDKPYFLTLGPHAFYWFSLEASAPAQIDLTAGGDRRSVLTVKSDWAEVFQERHQAELEKALRAWLPSRRWFGGKARTIKGVHVQEAIPVPVGKEKVYLTYVQVEYVQTEADLYALPLGCATGEAAEAVRREGPGGVIARLSLGNEHQEGILYDAMSNRGFCLALLDLISHRRSLTGKKGRLEACHTAVFRKLRKESGLELEPSASKAEQTNSSVIYGERLMLKLFRRLEPGVNPELEIGRLLTEQRFPHTPPLAGALEYDDHSEEPWTIGVLTSYIPKSKSAWEYTLDTLGRFYERIQALPPEQLHAPPIPSASVTKLAGVELTELAKDLVGTYHESARLLGERTAQMHLVLAANTQDKNFAPEPFTPHAQRGLVQGVRSQARQTFQLLNQRLKTLPPEIRPLAEEVLGLEGVLIKKAQAFYARHLSTVRIRHHGDYHLGQVLYTGKDFLLIDFEGEPSVPLSQRRIKRTALRDVAGMIRSFHYAAKSALLQQLERGTLSPALRGAAEAWAPFWARWVSAIFFHAYREAAGHASFVPFNDEEMRLLLDISLLRKAIYELGYELSHRPDWVGIPLQGLLELANEKI